jgi:dihydroorotase-like cyclic amidohydrolase
MVVDTTVRNGLVVTPGGIVRGGVAIEGERIVAVGLDEALPESRRVIDARGGYVIPGYLDAHVHLGPGGIDWPKTAGDFRTESRAAAYGGVTTALAFLFALDSYLPVLDDLIRWGEESSLVDFSFHAGINFQPQIEEIPALVERGITSFKHFFTAYRGEGGGTIEAMDPGLLYQSFKMIGAVGKGAVAQVHAEDMDLILLHEAEMRASGRRDLEAWSLSRPPVCEAITIDQIATIGREAGARPYIVHLSSAAGVDAVERAQRSGLDLIAETCPQYLTLDQTMEATIGCWGKVNPPIRTIADQDALWRALRDGSVTTLGTDHAPVDLKAKERGGGKYQNVWTSGLGIPNGMEHLLTVLLSAGVGGGRLDIQQLVRVGSENTAKAFGLYPRKGALLPGSDADLVIVDPTVEGEIGEDFFHGVAREWSPYFGYPIHGLPVLTMVRGTVVMENRQIVDETPRGRYLPRPVA